MITIEKFYNLITIFRVVTALITLEGLIYCILDFTLFIDAVSWLILFAHIYMVVVGIMSSVRLMSKLYPEELTKRLILDKWAHLSGVIINGLLFILIIAIEAGPGLNDLGKQFAVVVVIGFLTMLGHWIFRMNIIKKAQQGLQQGLLNQIQSNDQINYTRQN